MVLDTSKWSDALCVVYGAVNLRNGKMYIGATEQGLLLRRRKHLANAKRGQPGRFYTAVRKHGHEAFRFFVITECADFWRALEEERRLIAECAPEYNLTAGGGGVKGLKFSMESRAKMSASAKLRPARRFTREDIEKSVAVRAARGRRPVNDPVLLAKLAANGRRANEQRRRAVVCLTEGRRFISVTSAAAEYGVSAASIVTYCQGNAKPRSGLQFAYAEMR